MRRSILVACLSAVTIAGCGRTLIRETVVEKPASTPTTVIERPVVPSEAVVAAPASCSLGASVYASGSLSCQAGNEYLCSNGMWERMPHTAC